MSRGVFGMSVWALIGIVIMLVVLGLFLASVLVGFEAFGGQKNGLAFTAPIVVVWLKVSTSLSWQF